MTTYFDPSPLRLAAERLNLPVKGAHPRRVDGEHIPGALGRIYEMYANYCLELYLPCSDPQSEIDSIGPDRLRWT
jgi:hypothetical protein